MQQAELYKSLSSSDVGLTNETIKYYLKLFKIPSYICCFLQQFLKQPSSSLEAYFSTMFISMTGSNEERFIGFATRGQSEYVNFDDLAEVLYFEGCSPNYIDIFLAKFFLRKVKMPFYSRLNASDLKRSGFLGLLDEGNYHNDKEVEEVFNLLGSFVNSCSTNEFTYTESVIRILSNHMAVSENRSLTRIDYVQAVMCLKDPHLQTSVRYLFTLLDVDMDGYVSWLDLETLYMRQPMPLLPFRDALCLTLDAISPKELKKICAKDIYASNHAGEIFETFLSGHKGMKCEMSTTSDLSGYSEMKKEFYPKL